MFIREAVKICFFFDFLYRLEGCVLKLFEWSADKGGIGSDHGPVEHSYGNPGDVQVWVPLQNPMEHSLDEVGLPYDKTSLGPILTFPKAPLRPDVSAN